MLGDVVIAEKPEVEEKRDRIVLTMAADAKEIADDAQRDLDAAEPELRAAKKAVQDLDKNSIVEIKSLAKPPDGVKFVMECCMILLQEKTEWAAVRQTLNDPNAFMKRLIDYNVEKLSEKAWKKARDNYISKAQFDPVAVRKISEAASALCIWARASSTYQIVTKKVAPKKAKYAEVTEILKKAKAELDVKLA